MKNYTPGRSGARKMLLFMTVILLLEVLVVLTGCRSGRTYQARAAQEAREYLLANAPELTPDQIYFVKFNDPVLLVAPVLGKAGGGFAADDEKMASLQQQICVTWNIPGSQHLYMVFGVSDNRMYSWSPIRLIRKEFYQRALPEDTAIAACRSFAVNSLYHTLSAVDLNTIRFTVPWIARTDFEMNFNTTGRMTEQETAKAKEQAARLMQFSLYWINSDGSATVFCGAGKKDLSGWSINFAGHVSEKDLKKHTIAIVRTPEQPDEALKLPADSKSKK